MEETQDVSGVMTEAAAPVSDSPSEEQIDQSQERVVPLSALESERSQRQQMQEELRMVKEHLNLLHARSEQPQEREPDYSDDDVMTYGEFKKAASKFQNEVKMTLGELQMARQNPDYEEVIKKYLPEVIKEDPDLAESLRKSQDYKLAYKLAKSSEAYRRDHTEVKRNADAERILQNSQNVGSLSSVGGTSPINMAKRYRDMSDDDFRREVNKNMGYA